MKITLASHIAVVSGTTNGATYVRSAAGLIVRPQVQKAGMYSSKKIFPQSYYRQAISKWKTLTEAQRTNWRRFAQLVTWTYNWPSLQSPNGYHVFLRCNTLLARIGLSMITSPAAYQKVIPPIIVSFVAVSSPYSITCTISGTIPVQRNLIFELTPMLSAGINNPGHKLNWGSVSGVGAGPAISFSAAWTARYGQIAKAGMKIFTRLSIIDTNSGVRSSFAVASAIFS